MVKGSLVVYLKQGTQKQKSQALGCGYKLPQVDKVYTVREVQNIDGRVGLLLNEIINPIIDVHFNNGKIIRMESGFDANRFFELIDGDKILEEIGLENVNKQ